MRDIYKYLILYSLSYLLKPGGSYPHAQPALHMMGDRTRRDISCNVDVEYPHGSICCLSCPAGTYVKSACAKAGERGTCEECHVGTYAEHANGLQQCFRCTMCRSDEEVVRPCSPTQNTECQCKPGMFCHPDQACEVCKKCSRCESDEEVVRNCTATTNTECKKIQPKASSTSAVVLSVVLPCVLFAVIVAAVTIFWKKCRATDTQRSLSDGGKAGSDFPGSTNLSISRPLVRSKSCPGMEDEHIMLCQTPDSSASNSQHSLTIPPCAVQFTTPLQASPAFPARPERRENEPFPKLIPVNGEESLKACFQHFEDVDVDYHKRFFRNLNFSDNVIKSKDHLPYDDKIHELLNMWMEREGRQASLNDLLKALLDLNQRRSAEIIMDKAISGHHFVCEH